MTIIIKNSCKYIEESGLKSQLEHPTNNFNIFVS